MSYKLIIRLKNTTLGPVGFEWAFIDGHGAVQFGEEGAESAGQLEQLAKSIQQVIVLVPGEDVLLTQVKLPKLSPARLAKALPFALEDQLTVDPVTLHFAVGDTVKGAPLNVAVVSKENMAAWQQVLKLHLHEAYSQVKVFLPDMLAIPFEAGSYQVLIDNNLALIRTDKQAGMVIEKEVLFPVLSLILKRQSQAKPDAIHIHSAEPENIEPENILTAEQIAALSIPIQFTPLTNVFPLLASSLDMQHPFNLLQGVYAPAHRKISFEQLIWAGFAMVAAWLVVLTLADLTTYILLARERKALTNEMQTMYAMVYPKQTLPEDSKTTLQKELHTLRASRADSAFMRLLTMTGSSIAQVSNEGLQLSGMSYRNNQLMIDVQAKDLSLLEKLRQMLEAQGLKVIVSNAQRGTGGLTETRFTVEEIS